ncbi:MAG: DNA replication/repair protein RecF [Pseudomonadales bacterium]|nr:DNA replication/repair protein RecF [Pseudomonadales bacterium]
MQIRRVQLNHTRNLEAVDLDAFSQLNFFIGPNGSGKTSFLEAISIASLGRSFRSNKVHTVINQHQSQLNVFIALDDENGLTHKLGIQRDRKNSFIVRIDGANAKSLSQLSALLPLVILDANAFDLLDGSPSVRRKFIDWGVFHVEHAFLACWKNFNRILKQRNALLRKGIDDYDLYLPWDKELVNLSLQIEQFRLKYLSVFQQELKITLSALDKSLTDHKVFYKNGWGIDRQELQALDADGIVSFDATHLLALLKAGFERDLKYQRSHIGPHKADMEIKLSRLSVKDIYSRGQKKTLVAAMQLAQARVLSQLTSKRPILLLDDLPSELDAAHLKAFLGFVIAEGYQCFITSVDEQIYRQNMHTKARMFHVERGKITPYNGIEA